MAPKVVASYRLSVKHGKNDAADAQAICEALTRLLNCPVPVAITAIDAPFEGWANDFARTS